MRIHDPKTQPIFATDADPLRLVGVDGAGAIKAMLALGYLTPETPEYNQNYWRGSSLGDELYEPNTGLVVSIRSSVPKVKKPVVLSPHVTRILTTTSAVQFGQIVSLAADGTIEAATNSGQVLVGVAMMDADSGQSCWVCTGGVWYIQVGAGTAIDATAELTTTGAGHADVGVAAEMVFALGMTLPNYVVAGRNCRLAQIHSPYVLTV